MKNTVYFLAIMVLVLACHKQEDKLRTTEKFNKDWLFSLDADSTVIATDFDDSNWRKLNLPHDWSIEGKFSEDNPARVGGGALPGGVAWYRKKFVLPESDSSRNIYLKFDGIYQNSTVYINGNEVGFRPNGYISFEYDITPWVTFGNAENVIAVRVDNSKQPNSRWYSGSGIYRNVWLTKTAPVHIDTWGTYITTPEISSEKSTVKIETTVKNNSAQTQQVELITDIYNPQNQKVATASSFLNLEPKTKSVQKQEVFVKNPALWSIENPQLYQAISYVKAEGKLIDNYETTFGIRYFNFDADKGFLLNGKPLKILGVCNHHDLGALGSAVNTRAIERQLEIMKGMGVNGIRTSHNPPAPELLDLCDKMGFIVMDEAFDMWAKKKTTYDYSMYWEAWHEQDLKDMLLRDRNHPSVFIWSIGNEIPEQWDSTGITIARELAGIVKSVDSTRVITSACNDPVPGNYIIKSGVLDLIGFNYNHTEFAKFPETFPGQKFIATETTSSLNTRGHYDMPSDSIRRWPSRWDLPLLDGNPDNTCSAYDNCSAPWGSTHEETWKVMKKYDFLSGLFIWTGFDYLGEPTPYGWPSRSSYFGIVDLAGFPKDVYYLYQSEWTNKPVLHVFPNWNVPKNQPGWKSGQTIDVWAYTNFDEVELFINGKSQGVKSKQGDDLHLMWRVNYEPGTLKAVGKNKNGQTQEVVIKTAGEPAKIQLIADRSSIKADGEDLSFVTVNVLDKDGNLVPYADNLINFEVPGLITIAGVDNGSETSHEPFKASYRKAFNGKCLIILQAGTTQGTAMLKATAEGMEADSIEIQLK